MTDAGDFRYRIQFFQLNEVGDGYGNPSTGWISMFTVHANVTPRLGGETVEAARLAGRQPVVIRVRKSPDAVKIATDWKAVDQGGVEYNIRSVIDPLLGTPEHGLYIDMLAESGVAV